MERNSPQRPSEVFAAQLRRRRAGMTATELAERVTAQGVPISRELIERIERGERHAKLDELVAISAVLQSPLGVMLFGLGHVDRVGLTDDRAVHPDQWQQWLEGEDSAPEVSVTASPHWPIGHQPIWAYQELRRHQKRVDELRVAVQVARDTGDTEALTQRTDKLTAAIKEMGLAYRALPPEGRPEWVPDFIEEVRRLDQGGAG